MPVEITMPQLSDTMTEGTLIKWYKKVGDKIKPGEKIADIETDKAVMEQEAFDEHEGTLAQILVKEGEKAAVGQALAIVAGKGEKVEAGAKAPVAASAGAAAGSKSTPSGASSHDSELGHGPIEEGRAHARRETVHDEPEHSSEAISMEASATMHKSRGTMSAASTGIAERDEERGGDGARLRVSPLARRMAAEKDIDLKQINGSGPGGRIIQRDIVNFKPSERGSQGSQSLGFAKQDKKTSTPTPVLATRSSSGQKEVIPLTKIRSVIAQRLQQSKQNIPHFYETIDVDAEELVKLRERMNKTIEKTGVRISVGDFVAKAVATALVQHRAVNAHFNGTEITQYPDVHLGMAVALPNGLIVPVLRNINQMGLAEIRVRSADLVDRARAQKLKQDEMTGATFTVSNLGTYGVREFSAIINPPEVGILAIGGAEKRPVVRNDQLVARTMMTMTLSADHRVVDGATAAEFLRTLKGLLEEPGMMLV
ncbi:MAG TPA: dihydrolipoamide acetyltransferase family protein [Tepidisphaeraceae bacterium]|nr:dihydrolipoamide acetyltransferase family protein [Tepidisphaeraceae bacterium]